MRFPFFIHEIKTKGYDVIGVYVFLRTLMRILRKKEVNSVPPILLVSFRGNIPFEDKPSTSIVGKILFRRYLICVQNSR